MSALALIAAERGNNVPGAPGHQFGSFALFEGTIIGIAFVFARRHTMRFPRRQFLQIAAGVAGLPAMPRIASAQTAYPTRPITMIVPLAGVCGYRSIIEGTPRAERLR